jgi:arylsulfatase A-like enzyme
VQRESEGRDARLVPGEGVRTVDLGEISARAILRIGVLAADEPDAHVGIRMFAGDNLVSEFQTEGTAWTDRRVDLEEYGDTGSRCRIEFTSASQFWLAPCEMIQAQTATPNVLIYLADTVRLDHMSCYGYERETTPNLTVFAQEAVTFTQLMPQASWTRPSVASMLTSTYPAVHGANDSPDVLREGLPSMAAALQTAGYEAHWVMANASCHPYYGFGGDFFRYKNLSKNWRETDDVKIVEEAMDTLAFLSGRPWFLYVHVMGAHGPYQPPSPYDTLFEPEPADTGLEAKRRQMVALYDGEIAYADVLVTRFLERLRDQGEYDNTLIIFVSDHGEEFWEHGYLGHGKTLYEEQLRVPLLIKLPGGAHGGKTIDALVEMVDLAPTVLDILGLPEEERFQGASFLPLIETGAWSKEAGFASTEFEKTSARAAKTVTTKFVHDLVADRKWWTDLVADPRELQPLDVPPPSAQQLELHVLRRGMLGHHGLHVLVTGDWTSGRTVTGTIRGEHIQRVELRSWARTGSAKKVIVPGLGRGDEVRFTIPFVAPGEHLVSAAQASEQNSAHLLVGMDQPSKLTITLLADGVPMDEEDVFLGPEGLHQTLYNLEVDALDILGPPDTYDPAALPKQFAAYIWYVPSVDTVTKEELQPELREAMEGLGYL